MHALRIRRLRSLVRRRFQAAAVAHGAFGSRRLFPIVAPEQAHDVALLLVAGRVEDTLGRLAAADWACAEIRYG